jgi:hypothetical protein
MGANDTGDQQKCRTSGKARKLPYSDSLVKARLQYLADMPPGPLNVGLALNLGPSEILIFGEAPPVKGRADSAAPAPDHGTGWAVTTRTGGTVLGWVSDWALEMSGATLIRANTNKVRKNSIINRRMLFLRLPYNGDALSIERNGSVA